MTKYNSKELRKMEPVEQEIVELKRNPIYFVLDEVLDTYNIGSMFRLGDAVGVEKIYLCGNMEYPPSSRIHKSAVGTENWVPWEKVDSALKTIQRLRKEGIQIIAVEQDHRSIDYRKLNETNIQFPVAIVVGHESDGIKKEVL